MKRLLLCLGMAASGLLCVTDFVTSWMGVASICPKNNSVIVMWTPFVFAGLALSFNGLSSYMLRMFQTQQMTTFSKRFLVTTFFCFLAYDGISSFLGLLSSFSDREITSLSAAREAFGSLESSQRLLVLIVATLASFGPFLATTFFDLFQHEGGFKTSTQRRP